MKRISSSYYVRIKPQLNGRNAVHREDCPFLPDFGDRIYLGKFRNPREALIIAKAYYPGATSCFFCSAWCREAINEICDGGFKNAGMDRFDGSVCGKN